MSKISHLIDRLAIAQREADRAQDALEAARQASAQTQTAANVARARLNDEIRRLVGKAQRARTNQENNDGAHTGNRPTH